MNIEQFFSQGNSIPNFKQPPENESLVQRILKLAEFAARNGQQFVEVIKQKQKDNSDYYFLHEEDANNPFFKWCLFCIILNAPYDNPNESLDAYNQYMQNQQTNTASVCYLNNSQDQINQITGDTQTKVAVLEPAILQEVQTGFQQVLEALSGTKESIKSSQHWFIEVVNQDFTQTYGMVKMMLQFIQDLPFEKQIHVMYLSNDILFKCLSNKNAGSDSQLGKVPQAFQGYLPDMFVAVSLNVQGNEQNLSKLLKIVDFWTQRNVYDESFTLELRDLIKSPQAFVERKAHEKIEQEQKLKAEQDHAQEIYKQQQLQQQQQQQQQQLLQQQQTLAQNQAQPQMDGQDQLQSDLQASQVIPGNVSQYPQSQYPQQYPSAMLQDQSYQYGQLNQQNPLSQQQQQQQQQQQPQQSFASQQLPYSQQPQLQQTPQFFDNQQYVQQQQYQQYQQFPNQQQYQQQTYQQPQAYGLQDSAAGPQFSQQQQWTGNQYGQSQSQQDFLNQQQYFSQQPYANPQTYHADYGMNNVMINSQSAQTLQAPVIQGQNFNSQQQPVSNGTINQSTANFSFPPGLLPQLVRDKVTTDDLYSPLTIQEIHSAGVPKAPEVDSYLQSRLDRFYSEISEKRGAMTRAEFDDRKDGMERAEVRRKRRSALQQKEVVDPETGMMPDGTFVGREGQADKGSKSSYQGLGASRRQGYPSDKNEDAFSSYRKVRSGAYHSSMGKGQSNMAKGGK